MRRDIRFLAIALLFASILAASAVTHCVVCRQEISERVYFFTSAYLPDKQPVCGTCAQLETTCSVCTLPIRGQHLKIADDRRLCERDGRECVLSEDALQEVFADVKRDLFKMFAGQGTLPDRNVTVQLATKTDLDRLSRSQRFPHDKNLTMGLTMTQFKDGAFNHRIYVLIGLRKSRVAAICAHEFTHAWLQENMMQGRRIEVDTLEGFCELVAYKLMNDRNDAVEKKVIWDNSYTGGQVHNLLKAEDRYRFYELVKWIKSGVDEKIDAATASRVLVRKEEERAIQIGWQPVKATPVPDTLVLRGISGTPQRRFALVNDATIQKDEQAKVRVGGTNITVRCIDITERSVVLKVNGAAEPTELFLKR